MTIRKLEPVFMVELSCGCTLLESVDADRTQTLLYLERDPECRRVSHFTGRETGWPQLVDARKATVLPHVRVSDE